MLLFHALAVPLVAGWVAPRGGAVWERMRGGTHPCIVASDSWLHPLREADAALAATAACYHAAFTSLASSAEFTSSTWARRPLLVAEPVDGVAGSFTLDDLRHAVDSDFLEAGLGVADGSGGWKMSAVSEPRGSSYEDAKLRYVDVAHALQGGTVVFNSAGAHMPALGAISLAALEALSLPNCLNLYLTGANVKQSAPPHTDKQDVFVFQTCGTKHWRVFAPPTPANMPESDPFARGKGDTPLLPPRLPPPLPPLAPP